MGTYKWARLLASTVFERVRIADAEPTFSYRSANAFVADYRFVQISPILQLGLAHPDQLRRIISS